MGTPDFEKAVTLRRETLARVASQSASNAADDLANFRQTNDWRGAAANVGTIDSLLNEHHFDLSEKSQQALEDARTWVNKERESEAETERFQNALSGIQMLSTECNSRLRAGTPLSTKSSSDMLLSLERAWKEIEGFGRPVGDEILNTVRAASDAVRAESQRLRRARTIKVTFLSLAALILVSVAGVWWWRTQTATDFQDQLAQLQLSGEVAPAEKLLASVRAENPELARQPKLAGQIEKTDAWLRDSRTRESEISGLLEAIEIESAGKFIASDPETANSQVELIGNRIQDLPSSLRPDLQTRLDVVLIAFEGWIASERQSIAGDAETELSRFETIVDEKLRLDAQAGELAQIMEDLEPAVRAFSSRINPAMEALTLPAALTARFTRVSERVNLIRSQLDSLESCREGLLNASSLLDFQTALGAFSQLQITASEEVQAAGKLAAQFPSDDSLLAALLIPNNPVMWEAVKQDSADPWKPDKVFEVELEKFFKLRDDPALNAIHDVTLVNAAGTKRQIFSEGTIKDPIRNQNTEGEVRTWSGQFYDPQAPSSFPLDIYFNAKVYTLRLPETGRVGDEIANVTPSETMKAFQSLSLERMTDAAGEKYEIPILMQLERVVSFRETPPAFRAYLLDKLGEIANYRPNSWGLHYCEPLRADLAELKSLTGAVRLRSTDWLAPTQNELVKPLMDRCASRQYFAEAKAAQSIVSAALKAGIRLGGYIDSTGKPNLLGEARAGYTLWTLDEDAKLVVLETESPHLLAPVFFVPVRTSELIDKIKGGLSDDALNNLLSSIPLVSSKK